MGRHILSLWRSLFLFLPVAVTTLASAATPIVTTVAGGYLGNRKPATEASLAYPRSIVRDAKGNLYIGDWLHCRIRRIDTQGMIRNVAGTGICGFSGDGGPARSAMIDQPTGVALDPHGNLLFVDTNNARVRKINEAGTITTIAGNGTFGYSGDGGLAIQASLGSSYAISVDPSGKVYIADIANSVIRMIDTAGIIHTVAGNHSQGFSGDGGPATSAQLSLPLGVAADGSGNFYIADEDNGRVRKVDARGIITTYAGNGYEGNGGSGGPATSAGIGSAEGLLLVDGTLYISSTTNIWAVDLATQIIQLVAGDPSGAGGFNGDGHSALDSRFSGLMGMAADGAGNLFVVETGTNRVREINTSQTVSTFAGGWVGDGGPATAASLNFSTLWPHIAVDRAGNLYIADTSNCRVRKVSGGVITTIAGIGLCGYSGDGGPATAAMLGSVFAVVADDNGNIYIGENAIRKVDPTGTITTIAGSFGPAVALALGPDGSLYATDEFTVRKITQTGGTQIVAGVLYGLGYNGDGIPATQALLYYANGIALDQAGNLYIADLFNNRIRKVDSNGIISTVAGNGVAGYGGDGGPATAAMLWYPTDVAIDHQGNLLLADWLNARVRLVDNSGNIQTIVGNGKTGYNGNNLPALSTNVLPLALALDRKGHLYIADDGSFRVRKLH